MREDPRVPRGLWSSPSVPPGSLRAPGPSQCSGSSRPWPRWPGTAARSGDLLYCRSLRTSPVKRNGTGVELQTLDYENPGSNPDCGVKTLGKFFTLHCSSSLSCINEYLVIDSGGYVYEQPSRINCSIWLDASQRSRNGVWVNRSVREVKCKSNWTVLRTGYCAL